MSPKPSAEELQKLYEADRSPNGPDRGRRLLALVSASSFAGRRAPERQWIVPNLIPDRNVTDLSGDGGLGKSILALQLCMAMASETDWLGQMPTAGRALYVSCEDELDEIHRRVETIAERRQLRLAELKQFSFVDLTGEAATELVEPDGRQRLATTGLFRSLTGIVDSWRPKLIVMDTRADVFGGDEISRSQVRFFVRALRRLCFAHDCAILLLSHPSLAGMASGSGQSGSTAWGNSVRSRLYLERPKADNGAEVDPDLRVLSMKKANYGPADNTIALRWEGGIFRPDQIGTGTLDRLARDQHVEMRFLGLLRDLDRQGRHVNPSSGPNYAPKVFAIADGTIGHRQFKAAMDRLFAAGKLVVVPNGPPSKGSNKIAEVAI